MSTPNFQSKGPEQGKAFDEQCRLILRGLGFEVGERPFRVRDAGIEIDAEMKSQGGEVYWVEFKGSWLGQRPGSRRTDTVKKAIADAFLAHFVYPDVKMLLLTSHLPKRDSDGHQMLRKTLEAGALFEVINVNDPEDLDRLRALAERDPDAPS